MAAMGLQNGRWGLERCLPLNFEGSHQLLQNKFLDPNTPSTRKVDDEEKKRKRKITVFIVATNIIASQLTERQLTETPHARANMQQVALHCQLCHLIEFLPRLPSRSLWS